MTDAQHRHTADQLHAIAGYVEREYGHSGYLIGALSGAVFQVLVSDGSRIRFHVDRFGQVKRLCEHANPGEPSWSPGDHCPNEATYRWPGPQAYECDKHHAEYVDEQLRKEVAAR